MNLCASFLTLALVPLAAEASIVSNGGFELGTGADADGWNEIEVAGNGATSQADRVTSDARSGSAAMFLNVIGVPTFGPVAEVQQQTPVGSVTPGAAYDFEFFARGVAGPGSVGFFEVFWFDGDGSSGGGPQGSATGLQTYALGADYASAGMLNLVAPAGADSVLIQVRLVTGAFDGASGSAWIDDVRFAPVPEPAAAALAAGGALLLIARKPRR